MLGGGASSIWSKFCLSHAAPLRVPLINIMIATLGVSIVLQNVARADLGFRTVALSGFVCISGSGVRGLHRIAAADLDRPVLSGLIMGALHRVLPLTRGSASRCRLRRRTPTRRS